MGREEINSELKSTIIEELRGKIVLKGVSEEVLDWMAEDTVYRIHDYGWATPDKEALRSEIQYTVDEYKDGAYDDLSKRVKRDLNFQDPSFEAIYESVKEVLGESRNTCDLPDDIIEKMAKDGAQHLIDNGWIDPDLDAVRDEVDGLYDDYKYGKYADAEVKGEDPEL